MPRKPLHCEPILASEEEEEELTTQVPGWWLSGTSYDKRQGIKMRFNGVWNREKKAWYIPEQSHITSKQQLLRMYKKMPYDRGSRSERQQVRKQEQKERKQAHDHMHATLQTWMNQPLSSIPESDTLQVQAVSASHSSYYLLTGPTALVEQELAINHNNYLSTQRYEVDESRSLALAIVHNDTS